MKTEGFEWMEEERKVVKKTETGLNEWLYTKLVSGGGGHQLEGEMERKIY